LKEEAAEKQAGIMLKGVKMDKNKLVVFQDKKIRRLWHNDEWYFSIVDITAVLTDQPDNLKSRKYWNKLKQRLKEEGSEMVTICHQLKLQSSDGKYYKTNCAITKSLFRIIQSLQKTRDLLLPKLMSGEVRINA